MSHEPPDSGQDTWIVGQFIVDFKRQLVIKEDGEQSDIGSRPLQLLMLLIENKGEFISTKAIEDYLYKDQFKEESIVRKHILALRKAFGDTERQKTYIENRPTVGYRLIAQVAPYVKPEPEHETEQPKRRLFFWLVPSAVGMALLSFWGLFGKEAANLIEHQSSNQPLTHLRGLEFYPDVSPNEKWLAFSHKPEGEQYWQLYLKDINQNDLIPLTQGSFDDKFAKWSSDNQLLAFTRFSENSCQFMLADFNSKKRQLDNIRSVKSCVADSLSSQVELWPDNQGFYYVESSSLEVPFRVFSYSIGRSDGWQVTSPPPNGQGDYYIRLSHSGDYLAVLRSKNMLGTEIWLYQTETWESRLIDSVDVPLYTISWSSEDTHLVYRDQSNQIVSFDIAAEKRSLLTRSMVQVRAPVLLDDKALSVAAIKGSLISSDIIRTDLLGNELETLASSSYFDYLPAISTDGEQLAWISNRTGDYQLWYSNDQRLPRQLTELKTNIRFTSLSFNPQGNKLGGTAAGQWFIYDLVRQTMTWSEQSKGYFDNFSWRSNNERAFVVRKSAGLWQQFELDTQTGGVESIEIKPDAFIALEAFHSDRIYISRIDESGFWVVDKASGKESFIKTSSPLTYSYHWSLTDQGLYFVNEDETGWQFNFLPLDTTTVQQLNKDFPGNMITMPQSAESVITVKKHDGDTEIIQLK
ncbi:winged helix-turn-helix domain-containing protein [Pleionea sp. CnH1-48]|uniref:winged helix-turn-helix domain-containing protein n=1 Tax=Pleionea sp. CnH1-48 TaxID=2954494 RepID=UPI0020970714|nr:winged helix-turn-helix domain-containing protein [Pleionea sp. CnH1-48]MCO7223191.1 winged helix-turn-helix domain-containing protein [Pleionea sp. CnH1-48]